MPTLIRALLTLLASKEGRELIHRVHLRLQRGKSPEPKIGRELVKWALRAAYEQGRNHDGTPDVCRQVFWRQRKAAEHQLLTYIDHLEGTDQVADAAHAAAIGQASGR